MTNFANMIAWWCMRDWSSMTTTMNISLPETLKKYVRERVKEGNFSNPSDFVRTLIRGDQERQAERLLEQLLLEGLASGKASRLAPADMQAIRATVRTRLAKKQGV